MPERVSNCPPPRRASGGPEPTVRLGGLAKRAIGVCVLCLWGLGCGKSAPEDLSASQLSMVINGRRPELQKCYQQALSDNPSRTEVKMHAAIYIRPAGDVFKVDIDEGGLPGMAKCLETTIRAWRFPSAPDETHASLPLIFQPEQAPSIVDTPPQTP